MALGGVREGITPTSCVGNRQVKDRKHQGEKTGTPPSSTSPWTPLRTFTTKGAATIQFLVLLPPLPPTRGTKQPSSVVCLRRALLGALTRFLSAERCPVPAPPPPTPVGQRAVQQTSSRDVACSERCSRGSARTNALYLSTLLDRAVLVRGSSMCAQSAGLALSASRIGVVAPSNISITAGEAVPASAGRTIGPRDQ